MNLHGKRRGYIIYSLKQNEKGEVFYLGFKIADVSNPIVKIFRKEKPSSLTNKEINEIIYLIEGAPYEIINVPNPIRKSAKKRCTHKEIIIVCRGRSEKIILPNEAYQKIKSKYGSIKTALINLI